MRPLPAGIMALLNCLFCVAAVQAHQLSNSYLTLTQTTPGTSLEAQWDIALRDLEHAIGLDSNGDGAITWGELEARRAQVVHFALSHLSIDGLARGERQECRSETATLLFDQHVDGGYAVLKFRVRCPWEPVGVTLHYALLFDLDPNHRGLVDVRAAGQTQAFVLSDQTRTVTVTLSSPDRAGELRAFLDEGIWHIWKGYDHILFLLTLLLPAVLVRRAGSWQPRESLRDTVFDVLKVVTAFTVAHSFTLSLAVIGQVSLPSRWVESAIAGTVLLGAMNNLFPVVRERRWVVAFGFGLIHGLGFASVLTDLGLRSFNLALALIGFNMGVEIGQVVIVLLWTPLAYALRGTRFYRRALIPAGAAGIGCMAAYWLVVRATGVA